MSLWLRSRALVCGLFVLIMGLLCLVLWLSNGPLQGLGYALLLCGALLFMALLGDFLSLRARHLRLQSMLRGLPASLAQLPPERAPCDGDYQELLQRLAQQLRSAETKSDLRYQALSEYHAMWSHQIKTPIAAMRLLLKQEDNAHNRLLAGELFKVEQYVETALQHIRLQDDASDIVFARQPLLPIVRQAITKYANQFVLKRLQLQVNIPEDICVVSDAKWLGFVVEQLLSNAVKYSKPGDTVHIAYGQEDRCLSIQDEGIGISAEDLPRVFDLGYTGYNGRVFQTASGIGLHLCKKICKKLGIDIELSSLPGQGCRAALHLPEDGLQVE